MRLFIRLLMLTLCCALLMPAPARAESPDPTPVFLAALDAISQQTTGEPFALGEMKTDGAWAYAIATVRAGDDDHAAHSFVPMIATLEDARWVVLIGTPANAATFNALLLQVPVTLLDLATKDVLAQPIAGLHTLEANNLSGHHLPWRKGLQGFIAQRDGSGHANQVDFDIQGLAAAGDAVASKAGAVVFVKESSNAGSCDGANFSTVWKQTNLVVIRHSAGDYSWYVHLAFNSVPVQAGDVVSAGAKIGMEGATGFACGTHLHYMASSAIPAAWTDPANPNVAPWPPAGSVTQVDFDESPWPALAPGTWITSQNDGVPACPAPALQTPAEGATITATTLIATWGAVGGCAFNGYVARVQDTADPSAGTTLTETNTSTISATFTLDPTWANRDVFVQVRANAAGATWATRHVRWQPAPPGNYMLFENVNRAGAIFASSQTIIHLASVNFDDMARSMQVDAGVGVVLCSEPNLRGDCGRASGAASTNDLNLLAAGLAGKVSSVAACYGACPAAPLTPSLITPASAGVAFSGTVTLRWQSAGDAHEIEVIGGAMTSTLHLVWQAGAQREVILTASAQPYRWRVRAANGFGSGPWAEGSFKVVAIAQRVFLPVALRRN